MGYTFQTRCYTPLDEAAARALVQRPEALAEAYDADGESTRFGDALAQDETEEGLSVVTARDLREDEDGYGGGISDDFAIFVVPGPLPTPAELRARAEATGYATSIDPRAVERLASCSTSITVEFAGRIYDHPLAVALHQRFYEAVGPSVVVSGEDSVVSLSEDHVAKIAGELGVTWSEVLAARAREERARARKTRARMPPRTRQARTGEVESLAVHRLFQQGLADPFVSGRLQAGLRETTDAVRAYALALMEDGPQADAHHAKALGVSLAEVEALRERLHAVLENAMRKA